MAGNPDPIDPHKIARALIHRVAPPLASRTGTHQGAFAGPCGTKNCILIEGIFKGSETTTFVPEARRHINILLPIPVPHSEHVAGPSFFGLSI
jgi:hypothetical protein